MREIAVIADELKAVSTDIKAKTTAKDNAEKAYVEASKKLEEAQQKAADLKLELEESIGVLVPSSFTGRVRVSTAA